MTKNKNNETSSSNHRSPAHVPKLSAPDLWDRIQAQHARLAGDAAFVARLRAEGALKDPDPGPLLLEYLRFAYLAWTMPEGATPSKTVDEAWHAHILFTRSYERFCRETRGATLHHDPGGGDEGDARRFDEAYRRTLERYEDEFGPAPPAFWPRPAVPKPEPPPEIPKPVPKTLVYPAPSKTRPAYAFLLLAPAFAFVAAIVTHDAKIAFLVGLLGAAVGLVALIEFRGAGASGGHRNPRPTPPPVRRAPPRPSRPAPAPRATTAKGPTRRGCSSTTSTTADTPYIPFVDGNSHLSGTNHHGHGHGGHGDGGSHGSNGGHGDGGGSGGSSGGSSCSSGSSCGGGGCGGG